ncbi:hypothetical protein TNCT_670121, partial [Trichonephila clavata]
MLHICPRHHLKIDKNCFDNNHQLSLEEDTNVMTMKEKEHGESLTLEIRPEQLRLPLISKAKATTILHNKNDCVIHFVVDTNSPETLTIKPWEGCIEPRKE